MDMTPSTLSEETIVSQSVATPLELAIVLPTFNERDNLAPLMDRIADAAGIPLDDFVVDATNDVREDLGLHNYRSARNTLGDAGTLP